MRVSNSRCRASLCLALLVWAAAAHADSTSVQLWPEAEAYCQLGERSRLVATTKGIWDTPSTESSGGFASLDQVQYTINFDYTLAPPLRRDVPQGEWSQNRLLWGRLGYSYEPSVNSDDGPTNTVLLSLNLRYPLQGGVWLNSRARVDFRDVDGESSQRYRLRGGIERELEAFNRRLSPYADVEILYDTRYDKWSRATLRTGFETLLSQRWRVEPYIALQFDKPEDDLSRVVGLGLMFKYYFDAD